jgi:hypothetical protein
VNPAERHGGGQAAEKPSVRDDAALPPGDDVEHVIELIGVGRDVHQPGTNNRAGECPGRAAIGQLRVDAGALGQPHGQQPTGDHGHCQHEPVGVQRNPKGQVEEYGAHAS